MLICDEGLNAAIQPPRSTAVPESNVESTISMLYESVKAKQAPEMFDAELEHCDDEIRAEPPMMRTPAPDELDLMPFNLRFWKETMESG